MPTIPPACRGYRPSGSDVRVKPRLRGPSLRRYRAGRPLSRAVAEFGAGRVEAEMVSRTAYVIRYCRRGLREPVCAASAFPLLLEGHLLI